MNAAVIQQYSEIATMVGHSHRRGSCGALPRDMGSMDMGGMTHKMMPEEGENATSMDRMMSSEQMEHDPTMAAHMGYSSERPKSDADQHRADELVATLQTALAKYKDYHVAEADGYKPWHPEVKTNRPFHQDVVRAQGRIHFQPIAADLAAVQAHAGRRLRVGRRDVHRAQARERRSAGQARAAQHRAMAQASKFVRAEKGHRSIDRRLEEIRHGQYHNQAGVRRGRRGLLSAGLRMDGARLPVGEKPANGVGALIFEF